MIRIALRAIESRLNFMVLNRLELKFELKRNIKYYEICYLSSEIHPPPISIVLAAARPSEPGKWTTGKMGAILAPQSGLPHGLTPILGGSQDMEEPPKIACRSWESLHGPKDVPPPSIGLF